jgi:hypothetical protein
VWQEYVVDEKGWYGCERRSIVVRQWVEERMKADLH